AAERQVADADVVEKTKALLDLLQNPLGDDRLAVGQIQTIEHVERFGHRQIDVLGKRAILHLHRQAFLLQPPPAARRARTQGSKSTIVPRPWQSGHAPCGELNENARGVISGTLSPQSMQASRRENRRSPASYELMTTMSSARLRAVSIDSVRRRSMPPRTIRR